MQKFRANVITVLGENEEMDKLFLEYLDEYSITHKIIEENEWPLVEYIGGQISLTNMLKEKFGKDDDEIENLIEEIVK